MSRVQSSDVGAFHAADAGRTETAIASRLIGAEQQAAGFTGTMRIPSVRKRCVEWKMRRRQYELTQRTLSLIERFQNVAWFAHAGEPIDDPSIVLAREVRDVKHRFFTRAWENVRIDVRNQLSGYLCDHHPPRYHKGWNEIAEAAGKLLDSSVARLVEAGSAKLGLGALSTRAFEANIRRDIIGACHESVLTCIRRH